MRILMIVKLLPWTSKLILFNKFFIFHIFYREHANYIKKTTYDNLKIWDYTLDYLELLYDSGKGYEYLCQQLKIFLSHIRNQLVKKINESDEKKLLLN